MRNLDSIIRRVIKETHEEKSSRYMFFSNLEQMRRQCDLLLDLDRDMVEEILEHGHDWAQDHISEAKNNMDQVFDFLMNETNAEFDSEIRIKIGDVMMEGRKKKEQNFVREEKPPLKPNITYTPRHMLMVTLSKSVKEKNLD